MHPIDALRNKKVIITMFNSDKWLILDGIDFRKKSLFFLIIFLLPSNLPLTPERGSLEIELFIVVRIVH